MLLILDCAERANALLTPGATGFVHSVYRSTVNIEINGELLVLQPEDVPRTPISLTVDLTPDGFSRLQLQRGDVVSFDGILHAGRYLLDAGRAERWDPHLNCRRPEGVRALSELLPALRLELIRNSHSSCFVEAALHMPVAESVSECHRLSHRYANCFYGRALECDWRGAAEQCAGLIGLGQGLTPAGDDFNVGVIAALYAARGEKAADGFRELLSREILERFHSTTDVSAAFLKSAVYGEFSETVLGLFETGRPKEEVAGAVRRAMSVGHSSGADSMCGLLTAGEAIVRVTDGCQ